MLWEQYLPVFWREYYGILVVIFHFLEVILSVDDNVSVLEIIFVVVLIIYKCS